MEGDIDRVMQRTWRYWYEDGLAEMAVGVIFFLVGLLFLAEAMMRPGALTSLSAVGLPIVAIGGGILARRFVASAKARLIYPRTGYVSYHRKAGGRRLAAGAVAGAVGATLSALLLTWPASRSWIPALMGFAIGGSWLWLGYRVDLARYYALGLVSALAGAAAALAGLGDTLGCAFYFAVEGVALLVSGGLALRAYLRQTERLPEAGDHGQ